VSKISELFMNSSIGLYNSLGSTSATLNSSNQQVTDVSKAEAINDVSTEKKTEIGAGESLNLSTRSQKLHAISEEFFAQNNFTNIDTTALTQRAHEYGLISDNEYSTLANSSWFNKVEDNTDTESEEISLLDHLQNVKHKLDESGENSEDNDNGIIADGISHAISILSDVETAKLSPTFKEDMNNAIAQLSILSESDAFSSLDTAEQGAIESSAATLGIIDTISPQRLANPFVNRYIEFSQ